jgi:hypothetical protein
MSNGMGHYALSMNCHVIPIIIYRTRTQNLDSNECQKTVGQRKSQEKKEMHRSFMECDVEVCSLGYISVLGEIQAPRL